MTPLTQSQQDMFLEFRNADGLTSFFVMIDIYFCSSWLGLCFPLYPWYREKIRGPFEDETPTFVSLVLGINQWIWNYKEENK